MDVRCSTSKFKEIKTVALYTLPEVPNARPCLSFHESAENILVVLHDDVIACASDNKEHFKTMTETYTVADTAAEWADNSSSFL